MFVTGDLFVTAAERLTIALAGGLGLILVAERHHLRRLTGRTLFLRWRTWAMTAPLYGAAAMGPTVLALLFISAIAAQGMREYAALTKLPRHYRLSLYVAGVLSAPVLLSSITVWRAMPPVLLLAATVPALLRQDVRSGARDLAYAALGFAYIPWLLAYFLLIQRHIDGGRGILIALGTSVAVSDVCAFCLGKAVGRHKLAPALSPNKTWEGAAGNLVGALGGFALMSFALPGGLNPLVAWSLPIVVAAGCIWGDLVESLIKRQFGVKDAGTCLPGFGGVLDRIDSLLVVLPLAYTLLTLTA
jgi:phosphatidate cytidylyltransferase